MNKNIRLAMIVTVLFLIVVAAGSQTAWAQPAVQTLAANPVTQQKSAQTFTASNPGTVDAPPCDATIEGLIVSTNICGVAQIKDVPANTKLKVVTSPRQGDFLSKTITINFTNGSVKLCFASTNGSGSIYFQTLDGSLWTPLITTIENGQACAQVDMTGNYAFGH